MSYLEYFLIFLVIIEALVIWDCWETMERRRDENN